MKEKVAIQQRFYKPYHLGTETARNKEGSLSLIFTNFHLDDFNRELKLWLHVALVNEQSAYEEGGAREDLIDFTDQLHKLIEALYLIHRKRSAKKKRKLGKPLPKKIANIIENMNLPLFLSETEIDNPLIVIKSFCKTFNTDYVKAELLDMLEALITYDGRRRIYHGGLVSFYQHLHCLIIIAYSIYNKNKKRLDNI